MKDVSRTVLSAFALPMVLVASVMILLVILGTYAALTDDLQYYHIYHSKKQMRENQKSAMLLYCHDSTLCSYGDTLKFSLFEDKSEVAVVAEKWGLYEVVSVKNDYPEPFLTMVGRKTECEHKAALWLSDRHRPLSIASDTKIDGTLYIPMSGINYTAIGGRYYSGERIQSGGLKFSSAQLPSIDSSARNMTTQLCRLHENKQAKAGEYPGKYHSFTKPYSVVGRTGEIKDTLLGHVIIVGKELDFGESTCVSDVLVSARKVRVKSGFKGRMQIFASDTVIVKSGAILQYPSGIYIEPDENRPYVLIEKEAQVDGYVIVNSNHTDSEYRYPSFKQEREACLTGLLYVDGSCMIEGKVCGAVYMKDCYYSHNGQTYPKTLYDTEIIRGDSLAFPIYLTGSYERKLIKKLN